VSGELGNLETEEGGKRVKIRNKNLEQVKSKKWPLTLLPLFHPNMFGPVDSVGLCEKQLGSEVEETCSCYVVRFFVCSTI
jgi:hypothetical protein